MTFREEFPDFPAAEMPAMPDGFDDSSWKNDACPSIKNETLGLLVFVDYVDASLREHPETPRFVVLKLDAEGCLEDCESLLVTDDWSAVLALIDAKAVSAAIAAST